MDDLLDHLLVDPRQHPRRRTRRPSRERRPSIVSRAEKNGKSVPKSSLCVDAVLDRRDERLVEQPPPADERRHVGADVRMPADDRDRLLEPRVAHVRDHDRQSGWRSASSSSSAGRATSSEPARENVVPWWISIGSRSRSSASQTARNAGESGSMSW